MLLVILVVLIGLTILFAIFDDNNVFHFHNWDNYYMLTGCCSICLLIVCCILLTCVLLDWNVDKKIEMYQEENAIIEQQINDLVTNYMEYEQNTFKDFKSESSITLVSLCHELKSDELVQAQIDTYIENNNKIKELKEAAIDLSVLKWWLYFGH